MAEQQRFKMGYFRTEPQIVCDKCKKVCLWNDKIVNRYMTIPILDHTVIFHQCMECYWYKRILLIKFELYIIKSIY